MPAGGSGGRRSTIRVAALALMLLTGACNATGGPTASGITEPAQSAAPSVAGVPAAGCTIQQPPGQADAPPPVGGETDTTGQGAGRWRICVSSPVPSTVEGTAWCLWNADRTAVQEVSGMPASAGSLDYDSWLSFAPSKLEVHLTDQAHDGVIANYEPRQQVALATDSTHTKGTAAFDVALVVDPESGPPAGAPPTVGGTIVWLCGDPPLAG